MPILGGQSVCARGAMSQRRAHCSVIVATDWQLSSGSTTSRRYEQASISALECCICRWLMTALTHSICISHYPGSPHSHCVHLCTTTKSIVQAYEFMDTAIMVLRKNERQLSFLHVYHHASTFFPCWWSAINFAPGGDVYFICALNSSVHVLMCAS